MYEIELGLITDSLRSESDETYQEPLESYFHIISSVSLKQKL